MDKSLLMVSSLILKTDRAISKAIVVVLFRIDIYGRKAVLKMVRLCCPLQIFQCLVSISQELSDSAASLKIL